MWRTTLTHLIKRWARAAWRLLLNWKQTMKPFVRACRWVGAVWPGYKHTHTRMHACVRTQGSLTKGQVSKSLAAARLDRPGEAEAAWSRDWCSGKVLLLSPLGDRLGIRVWLRKRVCEGVLAYTCIHYMYLINPSTFTEWIVGPYLSLEIKVLRKDNNRFRCEIGSIIWKMTDWQVCKYASVSLMLLWLVSPQSNW